MQYKRGGLRNGAKEFRLMMLRPCPTTGPGRAKSRGKAKALVWRRGQSGHMANTWRTKFGDAAIAESRQTQGRHEADSRRTRGGHKADKLRGRGQGISRPAFFSISKIPTVNCLGKKGYSGVQTQFFRLLLHSFNSCTKLYD